MQKTILGILTLACFFHIASRLEVAGSVQAPGEVQLDDGPRWRRTSAGWERAERWLAVQPVYEPKLHPAVVGTLLALSSVGALLAFSKAPGRIELGAKEEKAQQLARPPGGRRPPLALRR